MRFSCFSPHDRAAKRRERKPLVTLDLNLTLMQTPAVKRVKLVITKRTNGNSVYTCLSAVNVLKPGNCLCNNPFLLEWYRLTYLFWSPYLTGAYKRVWDTDSVTIEIKIEIEIEIGQTYPTVPSVLPRKRINHIDLRVYINTNQSLRVRSWPCRLHESKNSSPR